MSPEQLFALASAKGIALDPAALVGRATDGSSYDASDVALACTGLTGLAYHAGLYTLAGADVERPIICVLLEHSLRWMREQQGWASTVLRINGERTEFDEELITLFVIEERRPAPFREAPELRACALKVESHEWRRTLSHQYQAISAEYQEALHRAEAHVRRRMRDDD